MKGAYDRGHINTSIYICTYVVQRIVHTIYIIRQYVNGMVKTIDRVIISGGCVSRKTCISVSSNSEVINFTCVENVFTQYTFFDQICL